jgi:hypothetical protein
MEVGSSRNGDGGYSSGNFVSVVIGGKWWSKNITIWAYC